MRLSQVPPAPRFGDLIAASLFETMAVVLALSAPGAPFLWPIALLAVFFIPGYALISALFPEPFWSSPGEEVWRAAAERALGAFVLSLMVVGVVGSFLSWSSWGLGTVSGGALVLVVTYGGTILAAYRRSNVRPTAEVESRPPRKAWFASPNNREKAVGIAAVAVVVLAAGVLLAAPPSAPEPYTQISISGQSGTLDDLPQNLTVGETGVVEIAVLNSMQMDMDYNLTVGIESEGTYQNYSALNWYDTNSLGAGHAFTTSVHLANGATFSADFNFVLQSAGRQQIIFSITGEGVDEQVWLWILGK
jgi:uncharacterized membrane protein